MFNSMQNNIDIEDHGHFLVTDLVRNTAEMFWELHLAWYTNRSVTMFI